MDHDRKPHHTFLYIWIVGAVIVLGVGMGYYSFQHPPTAHAPVMPLETNIGEMVATTTPEPISTQTSGTFVLGIGATGESHGWTLVPVRVVEDSRCPQGVECIQAGTVRVLVRVGTSTTPYTLTLAEPHTIPSGTITLVKVTPEPIAGTAPVPRDYQFTFLVTE